MVEKKQNSQSIKISQYLSNKITHLSVLLTIWVVRIHCYVPYSIEDGNLIVARLFDYMAYGLTRNAVPLFMLTSGMLFFWKVDDKGILSLVEGAKKRLFTLGVPYIAWGGVTTMIYLPMYVITNRISLSELSVYSVLKSIFAAEFLGQFWYIRYLLLFAVLSPAAYRILRNKRLFPFAVMIAVVFTPLSTIAVCVLYYILGAGIAIHAKKYFNAPMKRSISITAFILFLLIQLYRMQIYRPDIPNASARLTIPYLLYEVISPLTLWLAIDLIPFDRIRVRSFERHTFMVYAGHGLLTFIYGRSIYVLLQLPTTNVLFASVIFAVVPIGIAGSLFAFSTLLQKRLPVMHNVLTGGR